MRPLLAIVLGVCACSELPEPEVGVDVFAADTATATFTVVIAGPLEVGLRADRMYTARDRNIVLETPATLVFQRGEGTATVSSGDTTQRLVVQPTGIPLDSAERMGVTGTRVSATRVAGRRQVALKVEQP
jgi:hypothetical protein